MTEENYFVRARNHRLTANKYRIPAGRDKLTSVARLPSGTPLLGINEVSTLVILSQIADRDPPTRKHLLEKLKPFGRRVAKQIELLQKSKADDVKLTKDERVRALAEYFVLDR